MEEGTIPKIAPRKPNCISEKSWHRFEALKKRTDAVTQRSTEKRIKHLQKQILQNVEVHMPSEEERAVLNKHGAIVCSRPSDRQHETTDASNTDTSINKSPSTSSSTISPLREAGKFEELDKYIGVNDHVFKGAGISTGPKSGLEKQMETEIAHGNVQKAEKLSDQLSTRNYAVKIAEAVEARDYM